MSQQASQRPVDHSLRARFKRSLAREGLDGVSDLLTADNVAALSCVQAMKALAVLDARLSDAKAEVAKVRHNGNRKDKREERELAALEVLEMLTLKGIAANPDIQEHYARELEKMKAVASTDALFVWRGRTREKVLSRIDDVFTDLLRDNPEFAKLRHVMRRAGDAVLADAGLMPLGAMWDVRLKAALYPCPARLDDRIEVHGEEPGEEVPQSVFMLRDDVRASIGAMPPYLRTFLDETGYVVRVAELLSHIDPEYLETAGHGLSRSFDEVSKAVHTGSMRLIDIPVFNASMDDGTQIRVAASEGENDLDVTIAHEAFHGLDEAMDDFTLNCRELTDAFNADLADIAARDLPEGYLEEIRNYLPKSMGGIRETVRDARIEAAVEIGAEQSLGQNDRFISDYFPRTTVFMARLVRTQAIVYAACPEAGTIPTPQALASRIAKDSILDLPARSYLAP